MNMDGQKQTYEQFKADIFQWKDTHREEYRRFAKMMADGNEMQYLAVCRAIFKQLPGIKKEWQMSWCDDSTDAFRNIGLHFKDNAVPGADRGAVQETKGRGCNHSSVFLLGQGQVLF